MKEREAVTVFAPASVANVGCGFDIMGFALRGFGDNVTVSIAENGEAGILVNSGIYGHLLPDAMERNTAGVSVKAFLAAAGKSDTGIIISLEKNLPLGSGLGSSASSAVAAVLAVNILFGSPFTLHELIPFAMEGERVACGTSHADNVAPSLLGGFVLIRSYNPLDIISVKCPEDLFCTVVHPHIKLNTSDARRILKRDIPMGDVVKQTANSAAFMIGLIREDFELIGRSMSDLLAEPKRTQLIPGFEKVKQAAIGSGAIGCGISGSGPSLFALCRGESDSSVVADAMKSSFSGAGLDSDVIISQLNSPGAHKV